MNIGETHAQSKEICSLEFEGHGACINGISSESPALFLNNFALI